MIIKRLNTGIYTVINKGKVHVFDCPSRAKKYFIINTLKNFFIS